MSTVEEREARGKKCLHSAREARFKANGEPSKAPGHDEQLRERGVTASLGSKAKKKK